MGNVNQKTETQVIKPALLIALLLGEIAYVRNLAKNLQ